MVKVYFAPFARSLRALWTLEELGAPYEAVRVQFPPRMAQPDYMGINPLGQIPTMVDGDVTIYESVGICEYVAEKFGPSDLQVKAGEAGRADYLQWLWYGEATLMPPVGAMVRNALGPEDGRNPSALAEARESVLARLVLVEQALAGKDFLAAGRFTLADISVAYVLNLGTLLQLAPDYSPAIAAYFDRMKARPAFQAAVSKG